MKSARTKTGENRFSTWNNPGNLKLVEVIISRYTDFRFLSAHNAEIGIELAREHQPEIILMDINLTGMDGIAAFERLHENEQTAKIRVIAVSADAIPEQIERAKSVGFESYLTKPIVIKELLDSLKGIDIKT